MWFKKGKWVAYHGDERIGIHRDPDFLYRECYRRGIGKGEFFVGHIIARSQPPWAEIEIESGVEGPDDDVMPYSSSEPLP